MITAADADASPEICARRRAFPSPDEVANRVEADRSHDDQIDRHDEARQPRHDQDQDAGEEGDERRESKVRELGLLEPMQAQVELGSGKMSDDDN